MPITRQLNPDVYRSTRAPRNTIGELFNLVQGVSSVADSIRTRRTNEQTADDGKYINEVFGRNFAGWDGHDQTDLMKRQQKSVNEVLSSRPDLYSTVAPQMGKAKKDAMAVEEKALDIRGKRLENRETVQSIKTTDLKLQKDLLENLKWQQDRIGEQFALVDPGDQQSYDNAVGRINALGIKANLPPYAQFSQNPGAFYDQLIAGKTQNDQALQQMEVKSKELGIDKAGKELEWYDRIQQASINQKNRAGTTPGGPGGNMNVEAWALARKIGGVRGAKNLYPAIIQRVNSGETIDQIEDAVRYSGQSKEFMGPARSAMQQMFAGKTGKASDAAFDAFDDLLQAGDKDGMSSFLRRSARNTASADEAKQIAGQERTIQFMNDIQSDLDAYEAAGGDTNIFSGTMEKIAGAVGTVKDAKLRGFAQRIHTALQKYRRAMSGVAFSVPESKEYKMLFPGIDKTANFNRAAIDALKQTFGEDVRFFYENAMGKKAYNQFIEPSSTPITGGVDENALLDELFPE